MKTIFYKKRNVNDLTIGDIFSVAMRAAEELKKNGEVRVTYNALEIFYFTYKFNRLYCYHYEESETVYDYGYCNPLTWHEIEIYDVKRLLPAVQAYIIGINNFMGDMSITGFQKCTEYYDIEREIPRDYIYNGKLYGHVTTVEERFWDSEECKDVVVCKLLGYEWPDDDRFVGIDDELPF